MSSLTDLPSLAPTELANDDLLYVVDVSDNTDVAAGTSKSVSVDGVLRGGVPTASQLSSTAALQAYIDQELAKADRTGPIQLPKGEITVDDTIYIKRPGESDPIYGVTICGHGRTEVSSLVGQSLAASIDQGTRIVCTKSGGACFDVQGGNVNIKNLTIEAASCTPVLFSDITIDNSHQNTLENCAILGDEVGVSIVSGTIQQNMPRIVIDKCKITSSLYGIEKSGAEYCALTVTNTEVKTATTAVKIIGKCPATLSSCVTYSVDNFLDNASTQDNMTIVITNLSMLRSGNADKPRVVISTGSSKPIFIACTGVFVEEKTTDRQSISDVSYTADFTNHTLYGLPGNILNGQCQIVANLTIAPYGAVLTADDI